MKDLLLQFQEQWRAMQHLLPDQPALLAVSGGEDSMVMAHLFLNSNIPFAIAHCNFGLRAEASDLDEQLVQGWCEQNKIVFHTTRFDTKKYAEEWKKGTQETARILRYEWFETIRKEYGYAKVVTAHHANDNVETLLINLFKGTGISGLHGIRPHNGNIIRPLLFAPKEDLHNYAMAHNISYREDASNATDDYLRNAVRHNIVPAILQWFPNAIAHVNGSITRFSEAEQLYRSAIDRERKKLLEQRGKDFYLPILKLRHHQPLATICYELLQPFGFAAAQVPHVLGLLDAASGKHISSATHRIIRNRDFLIITALPEPAADLLIIDAAPCVVNTGKYTYSFFVTKKPIVIPTDPNEAYLDIKEITFPVILRLWRMGDYFYPLGMNMKMKKVSRLLIDQKVPLHEKEAIRIVECNKRIAWVSGMRIDERFRVKDSTEKVLVIKRWIN